MTSIAFIMAAGDSERFGGAPKHLIEIDGETLLQRTCGEFYGEVSDVILVSHNADAPNQESQFDAVLLPKHRTCLCDSILSTLPFWSDHERIIILLGDVFYTEACAKQILSDAHPITFFSDTMERYALAFDSKQNRFNSRPSRKHHSQGALQQFPRWT